MVSTADRPAQSVELKVRDWEAGGYALSYRQTVGGWWDDLERRLLVRAIGARRGMRVLDAGAGVGRVAFALAAAGCQVVALDFSFRSLRFLKLRSRFDAHHVMPLTATMTDSVPLSEQSMDAVVSCQVVQHIPTRDARVRAWRNIRDVTCAHGRLAALVYKALPDETNEGVFDSGIFYHRYTPAELVHELRAAGWLPVRVSAYYRRRWPSSLAPLAPQVVERVAARLHVLDGRARYLLVVARPA